GGFGAPHARAEFYDVQVELEDAELAEPALELPGEDGLLPLAQGAAWGRQPQILGQLLGDGRGPARRHALVDRLADRLADLAEVEARVREEVDVLGHQHRALEVRRDPRERPPGCFTPIVASGRPL